MKHILSLIAFVIFANISCAQTSEHIPFNSASSTRSPNSDNPIDNLYDNNDVTFCYWGGILNSYENDNITLSFNTKQYVDYIRIVRTDEGVDWPRIYPSFSVNYNSNDTLTNIGIIPENQKGSLYFDTKNSINNIALVCTSKPSDLWDWIASSYFFHEIEARRYHRLTLNVTGESDIIAKHSSAKYSSTTAPITILSTDSLVSYSATLTGTNRKFDSWSFNGKKVSDQASYAHIHTVKTIDGSGTMHATTTDYTPKFTKKTVNITHSSFIYPNPNSVESESNGSITYSSSDPSVASVDPNTGAITTHKDGVTTITATQSANGNYSLLNCSYTLTVKNRKLTVKTGTTVSTDTADPKYSTITIRQNGTLNVASKTYTDKLVLHISIAGLTYNIDNATDIVLNSLQINRMINSDYFYSFSIPFACSMSDLIASNSDLGTYGTDWIISEYDEPTRVSNEGKASSWVYLNPADQIVAYKGYTAAMASNKTGNYTLKFIKDFNSPTSLAEGADFSAFASPTNVGKAVDRGWNLVVCTFL